MGFRRRSRRLDSRGQWPQAGRHGAFDELLAFRALQEPGGAYEATHAVEEGAKVNRLPWVMGVMGVSRAAERSSAVHG